METLKIQIPEGYEVADFNKATGEVSFKAKPKKVTDRIKTVDDILADNGYTIDHFNKLCQDFTPDEKAYLIIKLLAKSLNEGWQPDWSNSNEYKYFPYFEMKGSSGFRFYDCGSLDSHSFVGSRLCFKSRELAEYAGKQFEKVYQQFMI